MKPSVLPVKIEQRIFFIRDQRVIVSGHLAELYGVAPKVLMQAVKRNFKRFPEDFIFQLSRTECANLKSQFVTSSWGGARRARPYAFTEHGAIMAATILNSPKAVAMSVYPDPPKRRMGFGVEEREAVYGKKFKANRNIC